MRYPSEFKENELTKIVDKHLGSCGRMISGSKSGYREVHKSNFPVFNSNIVTAKEKLWYGDIDLTLSEKELIGLAKELNDTVYVLREMDGRFENEKKPKIENAVLVVTPTDVTVGATESEYIERAKRGKYSGKLVKKVEFRR